MFTAACSGLVGETPANSTNQPNVTNSAQEATTTQASPTGCVRFTGDHTKDIDAGSAAADALTLSGETFLCAEDVVVVTPDDLNDVAAAAQLAAAVQGPLLFPEPRLAAELGRLKPSRVHIVGDAAVNAPDEAETVRHDAAGALALTAELLGTSQETTLPAVPDSSTVVQSVGALTDGDRVAKPAAPTSSTTSADPAIDTGRLVVGLAEIAEAPSLWVVDASSPETILMVSAFGHSIGADVLAIDGDDVLGHPELGQALGDQPEDTIRFIGGVPETSQWELTVLTNGVEVPGGGFYVLPSDRPRRYVAYYGHPDTEALGALGEQGPAKTRQVMQQFVEAYAGDGSQVIPTFEMIASVASAGPTDDGDYSYEWPPETFDPWIEFAAANDMYVIFDLQSGRDDFLSQAVQYEELLKLPFVGLALDPEWRLTDTQVHLQQVGTVDSAEINETVNWVADLVRDNGLPQKMMIVHQFRTSMITNRADIVERPEIQMIVQMDGDGLEAQKDATWASLLEGADDAHWSWGWKNFFDEDEPGPPSPESTMGKVPTPVYVSYQ